MTLGLLSFCQLDTNFRVTWKEGNPSKRFPPSVCPVCVCGWQMWEGPSPCGWWHPWAGGPGWHMGSTEQVRESKLVKAPSIVSASSSCPGFPWGWTESCDMKQTLFSPGCFVVIKTQQQNVIVATWQRRAEWESWIWRITLYDKWHHKQWLRSHKFLCVK